MSVVRCMPCYHYHDTLRDTVAAPFPRGDLLSSSDLEWSTPSPTKSPPSTSLRTHGQKPGTPLVDLLSVVETSASPCLSRNRSNVNMRRTPQPTLTQAKLTGNGMLQLQQPAGTQPHGTSEPPAGRATATSNSSVPGQLQADMDTSGPPDHGPVVSKAAPNLVTTEFLLQTLKANTDQIIKSFTTNLGALSSRVDGNSLRITDNTDCGH